MIWWLAGLAYLGLHGLLYLLVLRRFARFRRESGILALHALSWAGLAGVLGGALAVCEAAPTGAAVVGLVAAHAIYSMSWLELWGLSDGGYHLALLAYVRRHGSGGLGPSAWGRLLGDRKVSARLENLERLRLVILDNGHVVLTGFGRLVAGSLSVLRWLPGGTS